ncbi:MAG: hydrogenase maturation nickel metallochaperone HypA [Bacillota bacterium]
MHELSIVSSLIEIIATDAREKGLQEVTFVRLIIGALSSANPRAIEFALEHAKSGSILEGASFEIVVEEAQSKCVNCATLFEPQLPFLMCPSCGTPSSSFEKGREIYIDYYEGE